jgi:hypothetical protein
MGLAYYPEHQVDPLILDNLISDIHRASARKDLLSIYSFNDNSLWLSKQGEASQRIRDSSCLKKWNDLCDRLEGEFGCAINLLPE